MPARYTSATYAEYTRTSATTAQKNGDFGTSAQLSAGAPNPSM